MRVKNCLASAIAAASLVLSASAQQPAKPKPAASKPAARSGSAPARTQKEIKYPPLNEIKIPEPVRFELANGMTVYLVEDREVPMINVSALIRAGSRWEPVNKAGLAAITGAVIRSGGTTTRKGDQLDEELDRLGAIVETSVGQDSGNATISVLKADIDRALPILADLLQNPAFPEDKIDLEKTQHRDGIARRNDDPMGIAFREFDRLIYGKDSAYGRQTEYDTINAIKREDLVAFHKQYFQPESVVLGAWGDFDAAEMKGKIEKAFGGWAKGGRPKPAVPAVEAGARNRAGVYYINKEDVNQSTVIMGFLGGQRNEPDYYALSVANSILGGGFASRLFSQVRSQEGLAYFVSASWNAGWDHPGVFRANGGTKSQTTLKIINSIKREISRMSEAEVTDDELSRAKDSILKGFAFEFDSTGKIVRRMLTYEYYGYPRDYLQQYRANIDKVTKADILRVSKQYLKTDQLAVLVLGKEKDFEQPLSTLGKVAAIDITIPKPRQAELAAATPESMQKGKTLLAAARKAMGGDAIGNVKDYVTIGTLTVKTPQGEFALKLDSTTNLASRKLLTKMVTPMGEMVQGFDGQSLWMKTPQGTRDMGESQKSEAEGGFFRDTVGLLQSYEKFTVQAIGAAEVDGKQAEGVAITDPASKVQVKVYIDPTTNMIVKKTYTAAFMGAPGEIDEVFSDFREVEGLKLPFKSVMSQNGQKRGEMSVDSMKINPGLDDAAYKKPA